MLCFTKICILNFSFCIFTLNLFLFVSTNHTFNNQQTFQEKQVVHIALVYQNYARSKVYDKAFKESIRNINSGQSITILKKLPTKFILVPLDCILPRGRFFPSHVLDCLCGVVASHKVALIVFVSASEEFGESTAAAQYFLQMAVQTGIPIIAWNADNAGFTFSKPMSQYRILQLAPPIQHQVRAILALLRRYQWARFGVVMSKMAGSQKFLKMLQDEIQEQEDRSFNTTDRTRRIFQTSNAMFPPADDVLPMIIGLAPKFFGIGLSKLEFNKSFDKIISSNANCNSSRINWPIGKQIYENMRSSFLKGNPHHQKDGLDSFFYTFTEEGILRDSYLLISNLRSKRSRDSSSLLIDGEQGGTLHWERVGEFTNGQLRIADMEWPEGKANPPHGTPDKFHLKVVTLHEPPFVVVTELDPENSQCPGTLCDWGFENNTLLKCCTGYCVDLLNKLATDIGFSYTFYKVRDEKWGIKNEKGWNGLIQDLVTNKADMCVTSLKLNSERARDVDFSIPFLETGISILVKIRSGVLSPTAFLEPFEYSTWAIILIVSIQGAALSIFLFEWLSPDSFDKKNYPPPGHKFSICRSYWLVWATLFSASVSTDVPRSSVSRFMSLIWAAFGISLGGIYTANLAAFMITRVQYYQFIGVDDEKLNYPEHQNPPFRFGTVEGGNTHETMRQNWHRMHSYVETNKFYRDNISAGVESVRRGELDAFIYDAMVLDHQAGKDPNCGLMTVGKWASMTGYGIGFPKNSPLVSRVNHFMLQYQQRGDLERLQNFWLTGSCSPESNTQGSGSSPLGVENFLSAFFLLAVGILLSLICLAFEFLYCRHFRAPLKKLDQNGWCGIISMAMAKSLSFTEAVDRVQEWRRRWGRQEQVEENDIEKEEFVFHH
ncbi:Glutamate receptor ionotropic, NMDA 2B [Meloidogyne graminicola]|uniref:Glutamate receptor ionotropic, NMDA 2B n=1 Tax=Meloidogyne graminicola TaxID=189291 RepID=A0A8S9ZZ11_9BILA|nr:Glutamate receptor ionotropic, NMDA 2B [Meloidogyne graminicola]